MAFGAVALSVLIVAVLAPSAAHGLVATLVQVVNTTANPVINRDADAATRTPYQSVQEGNCDGLTICEITFPGPPPGTRLVIENVYTQLSLHAGSVAPTGHISGPGVYVGISGVADPYYSNDSANGVINNHFHLLLDSGGDPPIVSIYANYDGRAGGAVVTLTGYLINCAAVGCPAVTK